ncbi:MAG: hypothetical protein KJ956_09455 [Actinobacteria bacterium]|nr:hypothetical protein [Actinomycetota bacterium]
MACPTGIRILDTARLTADRDSTIDPADYPPRLACATGTMPVWSAPAKFG